MTERTNLTPEEIELASLFEEAEEAGLKARALLQRVSQEHLPEFPIIQVYNGNTSGHVQLRQEEALILNQGGYGQIYDTLLSREVNTSPMVVMTREGIFEVPTRIAFISLESYEVVPDWEEKKEIEPIDYLKYASRALELIKIEAEKSLTANTE